MTKYGLNRLKDLSIKYKLFIAFILSFSIPLIIFMLANSYYSAKDSENQALQSSRKVLLQAVSVLDYKAESIKNMVQVFALNDTVQELANQNADYYRENIGNWIIDNGKFQKVLVSMQSDPDITGLHLYMNDGLAAIAQTQNFLSIKSIVDTKWYKSIKSKGLIYQWFPSSYFPQNNTQAQITFVRIIPSSSNIQIPVGYIAADIPQKNIDDILNQGVFTKNTFLFILNSNNEIISSAGYNFLTNSSNTFSGYHELDYGSLASGNWDKTVLMNKKVLLGTYAITNTDWKVIMIVPYQDILELNVKTTNRMLVILLFVLPMAIPFTFWVASSGTKRIRKLIYQMKRVVNGNFDVGILPSNNDEIGELIKNFNYMLTKISMLLDDKFELGKENKNLELKALQAQINPHFLYNTLDLINVMSAKAKAPQISKLVKDLSNFYKLSLSKGKDIITIRDELNHIKFYVQIQNIRFEDCVNLNITVAEELYEYKILKIILQPIVENSILHGIREKEEEKGIITIGGNLEGSDVVLLVEDDGVGIPEEKLPYILTETSTSDLHGYGIANINERLKLYFGSEYGLTYSCRQGGGTKVTIRIPAQKSQN